MIFQNLIKKLYLDTQEFQFQFKSHSNYPSALAFSDTLNFLGIKNDAYNLEKEYWEELPKEFICLYNNDFALVQKQNGKYKIYTDKEEQISQKELLNNTADLVILFQRDEEQQKEKSVLHFSYFVYAVFGLMLLYSVVSQSWYSAVFNLLSLTGVFISLEIFNQKFGKESPVLNNFCGSTTGNSIQSSCTKIIDSDKINILGLKLSDFSLVYFSAVSLIGLFLPDTAGSLKWISLASVLAVCYSLVVQTFIEKALCRICMVIIGILSGQILISALYFGNDISLKVIFLPLFVFILLFSAVVFINDVLKQKEEYRKSNIKNLKFKRNYELFRRELLEKEKVIFQNTEIFRLGNPKAKLHISLVSNPYCGFCKDAHKILEQLLKKYPEAISAQIRFNYFKDEQNETYKNVISDFAFVYNSDKFLEAVDFWLENRDEKKLREKYNPDFVETDLSKIIKTAEENKALGFTFTPMFLINGYPFPDKYDREDIFYFIDDLIEDEEL